MRRKFRTYPEHTCLTCTRTTTAKNYCPVCRDSLMRMPYTPSKTLITADWHNSPAYRRNENTDGI